jgi:8-amino-7-oxononanoate synthase
MRLFDRWSASLDELEKQARRRTLLGGGGIDFSTNDYLGYGKRAGQREASPLPRSGRASRLLGGNHQIWDEVEAALARWHSAEAVLMMSSGYSANEGLLSAAIESGDWVASDEHNHASIIDGLCFHRPRRFVYRHNDLNHLEDGLRSETAAHAQGQERFIVTESLFSMDGDRAPLAGLVELAERFDAHVIVDEAHATGCFGPTGGGLVDMLGLRSRVLATVHTGGKALGIMGAYICGPERLKEWLINHCRHLIYTTALSPVVGGWWLQALSRVQKDAAGRQALHENAALFRARLRRHGVASPASDYIVPIVVGADGHAVALACFLQDKGWDIRAVRPPSVPAGTARLRVSIHADHDETTLAKAAAALAGALLEVGAASGH